MEKIIRLGIWGCGHGFDGHGKIVKQIPRVELRALCDKSRSRLKELCWANRINPICTTDAERMMSIVDAVVIATPDKDHMNHLRLAIRNGLHALVEKPIFTDQDSATEFRRLLLLARSKGLVVTSCHPRRFDPPFVWLKKNLRRFAARLGNVTQFHYDFTYHKPKANWKQLTRSLLLDHHGHEIDLLSFLFGAETFREQLHDDSPDRYLVTGSRRDGIGFSFHGTRRLEERVFREWMTVRFEHGSVVINTDTGKATIYDLPAVKKTAISCGTTNYAARSIGVTRNFLYSILGKAENYLTEAEMLLNNESGVALLQKGTYRYVAR